MHLRCKNVEPVANARLVRSAPVSAPRNLCFECEYRLNYCELIVKSAKKRISSTDSVQSSYCFSHMVIFNQFWAPFGGPNEPLLWPAMFYLSPYGFPRCAN